MNRFLLLLAVFLVSTAGLFAHRALAEATPLAIAAWRLGLAALFFVGWSSVAENNHTVAVVSRPFQIRLVLAGLCLAAHFVTWFAALGRASIANATLLACTTPLWTTLGSLLLGRRRPSARDGLALAIAGVGLLLVIHLAAQTTTPTNLLGDLFGLTAGLLFGCYLLCVEGLHETIPSRTQVTIAYSVAALALWTCLFLSESVTVHYSPGVWYSLLGMTLGPQIFGHTLLNGSLRHFPSSVVAFSILLEPVLAALLAWLLLHQALTLTQIGGGVLVLLALGLAIGQQTPEEKALDEPVG